MCRACWFNDMYKYNVECTAYFLIEVYVINHARQATRTQIIYLNTPPDNHNVVRN